MKKKTVIVNHRRFTVFLTICFLLASLALSGLFFSDSTNADMSEKSITVTVGCGDTLWNIAKKYCSKKKDIRAAVYEIQKLNGLSGAQIESGQTLIIPLI